MTDDERLQAEQRARRLIDEQLTRAGWVVQDLKDQALGAAVGVAAEAAVAAAIGVIPQEEMRRVRMGVARRSWLPGAGRGEERTSRG